MWSDVSNLKIRRDTYIAGASEQVIEVNFSTNRKHNSSSFQKLFLDQTEPHQLHHLKIAAGSKKGGYAFV